MPKDKRKFYESSREGMVSAKEIFPAVMDLVKPRSAVDLGCGVGGWLAAFMEAGVEDVSGYDGERVHLDDLLMPQNYFHGHDLRKPLPVERVFDLASRGAFAGGIALPFVPTLTKLSNVVLFSAAIPFQGGTNHLHEQWPAYWAQLFAKSKQCFSVVARSFGKR